MHNFYENDVFRLEIPICFCPYHFRDILNAYFRSLLGQNSLYVEMVETTKDIELEFWRKKKRISQIFKEYFFCPTVTKRWSARCQIAQNGSHYQKYDSKFHFDAIFATIFFLF